MPGTATPSAARPARAACALLLLGALAACGEPTTGPDGDLQVIAHRGASARAPEHTFAAYERALALGADWLEQDLQRTADGVLVVLHDETLDRTARGPQADCTGPVREKTLAQLRRCDAGAWFGPEFAGARIPTLREVLLRYGRDARYYIETKNPEAAPGMEDALLALLEELPREVIVQSFSAASLRHLHARAPELPLVQLFGRREGRAAIRDALPEVATYATGIGPYHENVDRTLVAAAHARGLVVHPWTVNDPAEMQRLAAIGVDGVFTDLPAGG